MPDIDEDENPDTAHIDSRHLPVEPRNKLQQYQSTPPQRIQYSYSPVPVTQKQNTPGHQTLISEDEYLELIRNTDLAKNAQTAGTKTAFSYATATPTTSVVDYEYSTKSQSQSQFTNNHEFKKYSSRTQVPSTASSPVPHLQPQNSQQQFVRQPVHYLQPTSHYVTSGPTQDYSATYDKDVIRVNLKKYHEPAGKTKYDPARGQYHQEVKPTKKLTNFKPSYQYATTPQIQPQQQPQPQQQLQPQLSSSNQQTIIQSQPLHYQSVQQISQTDQSKSNQQQQPQSQYSIVVPQSHAQAQQAYYQAESNHPFQTYLTQNERLVSNPFGQTGPEPAHLQATAPQQSESKPGQPDFRIQYIQHEYTATPTPTPTPRARYVPENTPSQPLKYELYEPNGAAPKEQQKLKLVPAPQHVQRPQYAPPPQYYKKIKVQPSAHVHYVPVRQQQYHQPTPQPSESSPQAQSDLYPLQPSRSTLFVSTGNVKCFGEIYRFSYEI